MGQKVVIFRAKNLVFSEQQQHYFLALFALENTLFLVSFWSHIRNVLNLSSQNISQHFLSSSAVLTSFRSGFIPS